MDWINTVLKKLDHDRYLVLGIVLGLVALGWVVGCESTTRGVGERSGEELTRSEFVRNLDDEEAALEQERLRWVATGKDLEAQFAAAVAAWQANGEQWSAEAEQLVRAAERGLDDLEQQDQKRRALVEAVGGLVTDAAAGSLNPVSALTAGLGLFGIFAGGGAMANGVRKDKVIDEKKRRLAELEARTAGVRPNGSGEVIG